MIMNWYMEVYMSKYNSKKITIDGITFASIDEGKYYEALKTRKAKGEIQSFGLQPKFVLMDKFKKNNKSYRAITYTLDFEVVHNNNSVEYVDVKGMATQQGEMRIKLFHNRYRDLNLSIVARSLKYGDEYGFIDFYTLKKIRSKNRKEKKNGEVQNL